jgi:hypothetical protein
MQSFPDKKCKIWSPQRDHETETEVRHGAIKVYNGTSPGLRNSVSEDIQLRPKNRQKVARQSVGVRARAVGEAAGRSSTCTGHEGRGHGPFWIRGLRRGQQEYGFMAPCRFSIGGRGVRACV